MPVTPFLESSELTVARTVSATSALKTQIEEAWLKLAHRAADLIPEEIFDVEFTKKFGFDRETESDETWALPEFLKNIGENPDFYWCIYTNKIEEMGLSNSDYAVSQFMRLSEAWKPIMTMVVDYKHDRIVMTFVLK